MGTNPPKNQIKSDDTMLFFTAEEMSDPKNEPKLVHKSVSPKYDQQGNLVGYNVGGWSESYMKNHPPKKSTK